MESRNILCQFNNGEQRVLNLAAIIKDKYGDKILSDESVFRSAKIGRFGEIVWEGAAEIIGLNGNIEPCQYDISPEFAYINSKPVSMENKR